MVSMVSMRCLRVGIIVFVTFSLERSHTHTVDKILCEVCRHAVMEASEQSRKARDPDDQQNGHVKQRIRDQICDRNTPFGSWITRYDLVTDAENRLRLADQGAVREECGAACESITHACHRAIAAENRQRLWEGLSENKHWNVMIQVICNEVCQDVGEVPEKNPIGEDADL